MVMAAVATLAICCHSALGPCLLQEPLKGLVLIGAQLVERAAAALAFHQCFTPRQSRLQETLKRIARSGVRVGLALTRVPAKAVAPGLVVGAAKCSTGPAPKVQLSSCLL